MRSELDAPLRAIVGEQPRYAENLAELRTAHANLQPGDGEAGPPATLSVSCTAERTAGFH